MAFSFRALLLVMDALMIGSSPAIGLRNHLQTWSADQELQQLPIEKLFVVLDCNGPQSMPKMCLGLVLISYSYTAKPRSAKINKAKKTTTNFRNYEVFRAFKRLMNCVTLQFSGILSVYRHGSSSSSLLYYGHDRCLRLSAAELR